MNLKSKELSTTFMETSKNVFKHSFKSVVNVPIKSLVWPPLKCVGAVYVLYFFTVVQCSSSFLFLLKLLVPKL